MDIHIVQQQTHTFFALNMGIFRVSALSALMLYRCYEPVKITVLLDIRNILSLINMVQLGGFPCISIVDQSKGSATPRNPVRDFTFFKILKVLGEISDFKIIESRVFLIT